MVTGFGTPPAWAIEVSAAKGLTSRGFCAAWVQKFAAPFESAVSRLQKDVSLSRELPAPGARLSRELSAPSAPGPTPRVLETYGSAALRGLEADHSLDRSREHRFQTSQRRMALGEHHSLDPSHRAGNTCHFEKASDNATDDIFEI